eukprot:2416336-Amphidinium_carterae.2
MTDHASRIERVVVIASAHLVRVFSWCVCFPIDGLQKQLVLHLFGPVLMAVLALVQAVEEVIPTCGRLVRQVPQ